MKKLRTKLLDKNSDADFAVELEPSGYICPYTDCGREFTKPIIVTNKSVDPPQTYFGCPYCLSKIDVQLPEIEKVEEKVEQASKLVEIKKLIEKTLKRLKKQKRKKKKENAHTPSDI